MGNMFSNTLVEMVNKCENDSEEDGCDKTMTVDGKKVRISIVDLQDTKDGMETEVQHLYVSDDIYDEMNYLIKLKKNNNCDGLLNIEYKCGVPDDIDDSADTNDDTADTTADTTTDATETVEDDVAAALEPYLNMNIPFEFNESCMVITIIFAILFMYKEEIMKTNLVKKLLK